MLCAFIAACLLLLLQQLLYQIVHDIVQCQWYQENSDALNHEGSQKDVQQGLV
jgi:hypothetical protein